jgi:asparagine synthase (glutamine-hydrolysing)
VLDESTLATMTDAMTHRGPDDRGIHVDDGVALGVRRLSIVDVAGGHQPIANETGEVWAIQNGELYNHLGLRRELEAHGHVFRNRCDTEVLPHLYEQFGPRFPTKLRGMFGLAVWDARERRAVIARDRLGIKPLYYAERDGLLIFASELKSLLASGLVEPVLDYEAIDAFLTFGYTPGPSTPLSRVSKLMPGHILFVADGTFSCEPYWQSPIPQPMQLSNPQEYEQLLIEKLDESVRLRLMSDVPLGAMLSGGLDSSVIVALMARHMKEPVKTFSVGFAEAGAENELADARRVAEFLGTEHHELELSFSEDAVDIEELVWHLDEPLADLSALGFLSLCELASRHVTVALSGQGADELLGGYSRHQAAAMAGRWQRLPAPARAVGERLAPLTPGRIRRAVPTLATASTVDRFLTMATGNRVDTELRHRLRAGPLAELDGQSARRALLGRMDGLPDDPLPATLYVDVQLALVDDMLHYFDRTSMAHSLEVRVPFLDHELVELCARIPADLKVRRLRTKHILREAVRGLVPDWVIDKRKVGFFHGAVGGWFAGHARNSVERYLGADARTAEFLDPAAVRELIARSDDGQSSAKHLLLSVLVLEVWLASFLPRALAPPPPRLLSLG